MHFVIGDKYIEVDMFDSKREFLNKLNSTPHFLLGDRSEQEKSFFSLSIYNLDLSVITIGIISQGHGLKPNLLFLPSTESILIGFNKELTCYNIVEKTIKSIKLSSLFFKFIHLPKQGKVVAIHETGVNCLDDDGNLLWLSDCDIIETFSITNNILVLKCMDQSIISICIDTGEVK